MSQHRAPVPPAADPGWTAVLTCVLARAYLGVLAGLLVWAVLPAAIGWQTSMIMSGSMSPSILTGDVVVAEPRTDATAGQVVVADDPDHPGRSRTHRVALERPDGMLVLQGDANPQPDSSPVARSDLQGIARLRVPYVALPAVWMRTGREAAAGAWLLVTILAILLAPSGGARRPAPLSEATRPGVRLTARGRRCGRPVPAHRQAGRRLASGYGGAFGIAVVSTAVLVIGGTEGAGTHAAFLDTTVSNASFSAQWCTAPGAVTVTADADDWVDQAAPTTPQSGTSLLWVTSSAGANRRTLVRFPFPVMPSGCQVTGATMTLTTQAGTTGRTIEASAARAAWAEGSVTWNNMPTTFNNLSATAASVNTGPLEFDATDLVTRMYSADVNHGFVLRDTVEDANANAEQPLASRESVRREPTLTVTFG